MPNLSSIFSFRKWFCYLWTENNNKYYNSKFNLYCKDSSLVGIGLHFSNISVEEISIRKIFTFLFTYVQGVSELNDKNVQT